MKLHDKYMDFLNGIRQVDATLVESIEMGYKLIFEAGNATDIDEENASYTMGDIAKIKQSAAKGGVAYGMHKQAQGTHSTQDSGVFTGHMAGTKSDRRANIEESLTEPSQDDMDDCKSFLEQYGLPEKVINEMLGLIKQTSHGQIDLIMEYIESSLESNSIEKAISDIIASLKDSVVWASKQSAKLAQAGADYYRHEVSDLDNDFGTLFFRGSKYKDMIDMVVEEGQAKIGAERKLNIPNEIRQAAKGKGLSDKEIKQLDRKYAEIIKAIKNTQSEFIRYIWRKIKSLGNDANNEIINRIIARNKPLHAAANSALAKGDDKLWNTYVATRIEWPYRGTGAYQTMFKELSTGVVSDNTKKATAALKQLEMTPDDVIKMVTGGLTKIGASDYLNDFLQNYKSTELQGLSDDSPEVLAASAMSNSGGEDTYNRIIHTLLAGKKETA